MASQAMNNGTAPASRLLNPVAGYGVALLVSLGFWSLLLGVLF